MHWLQHFFGVDSGSGQAYLFWSGAGSDLAELAIVGGLISIYRKHNCQVKGCPRIGRYEFAEPDSGVKRLLCWKHHPDMPERQLTRQRLHLYVGKNPGKG